MSEPETANSNTSRDTGSRTNDGPRIYVACLAAYNNGCLYGHWIDAVQDVDAIRSEISDMLADSPIPCAEEWAIHDYEGFEGAMIREHFDIKRVAALAKFIVERGELGGKVIEHFGGDLDDAKAAFDEYAGEHKCLAEFAQDLIEETTDIPESLANYIDYKAIARDMELNGDVFTIELGFDEVHVFWSR